MVIKPSKQLWQCLYVWFLFNFQWSFFRNQQVYGATQLSNWTLLFIRPKFGKCFHKRNLTWTFFLNCEIRNSRLRLCDRNIWYTLADEGRDRNPIAFFYWLYAFGMYEIKKYNNLEDSNIIKLYEGILNDLMIKYFFILTSLIGFIHTNWQIQMYYIALAPLVYVLIFHWVLPISPAWLYSRGKNEKGLLLLHRVTKNPRLKLLSN